jgi:hypothetical protein
MTPVTPSRTAALPRSPKFAHRDEVLEATSSTPPAATIWVTV